MEKEEAEWEPVVTQKSAAIELGNANNLTVADIESTGVDIRKLLEDSCIKCNKLLKSGAVRIVPPKYVQDRDKYVRIGWVWRRPMCMPCFNKAAAGTKSKPRERIRHKRLSGKLAKSLIREVTLRTMFAVNRVELSAFRFRHRLDVHSNKVEVVVKPYR